MLSKNRYSTVSRTEHLPARLLSILLLMVVISLADIGTAWAESVQAPIASSVQEAKTTALPFPQPATQPSDYFAQILLSLIFILLIIFFAAWLLRRYGRFPGVADGNLKVLGALSVGPRERILMLQVGKEQILVGVTSAKITKLHQLAEPVEISPPIAVGGAFAQRLQEAMQAKAVTKTTQPTGEDQS